MAWFTLSGSAPNIVATSDTAANQLYAGLAKMFGPDLPQPSQNQAWSAWRATGSLAGLLPAASWDADVWRTQ